MIFRFHHNRHGGHVRIGVFAASRPEVTFEKLGELTLRTDEWPDLRTLLHESPGFLAVHGRDEGGTIDVEAHAGGDTPDDPTLIRFGGPL